MIDRPKKSAGGPKTDKGKQASSQNALVHGATSNKVTSAGQQSLVEQFEHELTAYYQPESPLEKLQIQRIALYKAKLHHLYELEQVKLQIAYEDLKGNPNLVMEKVYSSEDLTRTFARTLSNGKPLNLPMNLTPELLAIFTEEINSAGGKLDPDDDLYTQLPKLGAFIKDVESKLKISGYQVILRIGNSIQEIFTKNQKDHSELTELLYLGLEVMEARARGDQAYAIKANKLEAEENLDDKKINEALSAIAKLNLVLVKAYEVAKEFQQRQDLMLRAVTLGGEESDRLLRYQTTWERRLSSAIGELLALQAKNVK
jgi:hypothetical protein